MIVIGAGPAGSTTARYAARRGHSVLLIEKRKQIGYPIQCGEYIAHNSEIEMIFPGVSDLDDLMKAAYESKQIDTDVIRIISPLDRTFEIDFHGFTIDRAAMDQKIASQAVDEGTELKTNVTVTNVVGNTVVTREQTFQAKVIVGADGPKSRVTRCLGFQWPISSPAMNARISGQFSTVTELYFGNLAPGGYAWIIPRGNNANVGLGVWPKYKQRVDALFEAFLHKLGLPKVKGTGGYVPIMGPIPKTVKGNVILVGDAAGHVMPTNGGGINVGMICGRIAGETISQHLTSGTPLSEYERRWRVLVGKALVRGRRTRKLGDLFFGNEKRLEFAMHFLGPKRMARAIRCQRLFLAR